MSHSNGISKELLSAIMQEYLYANTLKLSKETFVAILLPNESNCPC